MASDASAADEKRWLGSILPLAWGFWKEAEVAFEENERSIL